MAKTKDMRIESLPLEEVARWPRNPKLHAEADLDASIDRFGFTSPILMDEGTGKLVAGHGRLDALLRRKAAGQPPPARVSVDEDGRWLIPVIRGVSFADEAEAEAYLIADNRLSEIGGWDERMLGEMIKGAGDALAKATIGWTQPEVDRLVGLASGALPESSLQAEGARELGMDDLGGQEHKCPRCGFVF